MVRVFLKGGVWKNSEDEVLKAAVQKYGKQQWARVASLLNRKTAKQAKARWYEWLDPSIKKTEWSREEEEKLLHLAKLIPAQWKTIGPLVGRTATQCQEHYERLLDQAATASASSVSGEGSGEDDLRKQAALRPGQIDSHPETKPAKPDPIDMDEDELEMLQEARARLANTMGKKAKRKQREKMLAQAKRLADLQKRRELKAAGLLSQAALKKSRLRRGEIDLGVEIPFYKPAPAGFHDVSQEQSRTESIREKRWKQVDLHQVNENRYRTRDLEEAQRQKREERRLQVLQQVNETYAKEKKQQDEAALARPARGSLKLPEPTLTDSELSELAKRQQQEILRPAMLGGGSDATKALVGDYTDRPLPTPMRTPFSGAASVAASTSTRRDLVQEASQLRRLERGQTPLMMATGGGGAEQDDDDDDVDDYGQQGQDRKMSASAATPLLPADRSFKGGATPLSAAMPRDELGLNRPSIIAASIRAGEGATITDTDAASVGASTWATQTTIAIRELARQERRQAKRARLELEAALAALPAPQYEYELAAPATTPDDDDEDEGGLKRVTTVEEDQADMEAAQREELRKQAQKKYEARSTVLKRNDLPRPPRPCVLFDEDAAKRLIQEELLALLQHDTHAYPIATTKKRKRKQDATAVMEDLVVPEKPLEVIPQNALELAREAIDTELLELMNDKVVSVLTDNKASNPEEALAVLSREVILASRSGSGKMVYTEKGWIEPTCDKEILESLMLEFEALKDATEALRKKNDKLESKLNVVNGGYVKRSEKCSDEILQAFSATQNARIEQSVYRMLQSQEVTGGTERIDRLQEDVKRLQAMEAELQKQYGDLMVERRRKMVRAGAASGGQSLP